MTLALFFSACSWEIKFSSCPSFHQFLLVWLQEPLLGWGATVLDKIQTSSSHGIIRIPLLLSIQFSSSIHISAFPMFYLNCSETMKRINRRRSSSPITKPLKGNFTKLLPDLVSVRLYPCKIQTRFFSLATHVAKQEECLQASCHAPFSSFNLIKH